MAVKDSVFEQIQVFNQGRDPDRLQLKYEKMQTDCFSFYRGTCHLFYADWPADSMLNQAPLTWLCGDLHLENFGSFKGDDRQVYFDINDFDEAVLAPCTWDLARLITSIFVAAQTLKVTPSQAEALADICLTTYTAALAKGKALNVLAETAEGMIKDLLKHLQHRSRKEFLNQYTNGSKITLAPRKRIALSPQERSQVVASVASWARTQANPKFFQVLDVVGRIAGTGSLGVKRYLLLIEGSSPNQNYLLDLKQIYPSSLQPALKRLQLDALQPDWTNEATRVISSQTYAQFTSPALLHALAFADEANGSYVLRELQQTEDRLSLEQWHGKIQRLEQVIQTMAQLLAWGQLRSSGKRGGAIADHLTAFAQRADWQPVLLDYAQTYASQVEADYQKFCAELGKQQ
jgi:uncharacterized protein (DUF2252 family)